MRKILAGLLAAAMLPGWLVLSAQQQDAGPLAAQSSDVAVSGSNDLPDAPGEQAVTQQSTVAPPVQAGLQKPLIYIFPGRITAQRLTLGDKWVLYSRDTFGPRALVSPVIAAAIRLSRTPGNYPDAWQPSVGGFGRQYGNGLAILGARNTGHYVTSLALHEDPRYAPATSENVAVRLGHALIFTFIDKGDSGDWQPAVANFVGALAGGFVGDAYMPAGYNDITHGGQRSIRELGVYAATNITREFTPEFGSLLHKLHIPNGEIPIPAWWTPEKKPKP